MNTLTQTLDTATPALDQSAAAPEHHDAREESAHQALRFLTAGSVDDGKSTLIGRLLLDAQGILSDQLDALERRAAGAPIDLSLLTDGLEAEREQGITIDVAYRYFATPARKFIIADAPGHEQYTRNMVTAAAGSDAAVVLVDITKLKLSGDASSPAQGKGTTGSPLPSVTLLPQTRRHSLLAHRLRVPSIVFAVNKLDALPPEQAQQAFEAVSAALRQFADEAGLVPSAIVPVSALRGDGVATPSAHWNWYQGPTLLQVLEGLPAAGEAHEGALLMPVQFVSREDAHGSTEPTAGRPSGTGHQPRVIWGRVARGSVRPGDPVVVFPSGQTALVASVRHAGVEVDGCEAGQSAGIVLDRHLDISRGDWLLTPGSAAPTDSFSATLAWLDTEPAVPGRKYWVRHGHRWVQTRLLSIEHRLDIHDLSTSAAAQLEVNEIGRVQFQLQQPLPLQPYAENRVSGALIVVDPSTNRTSGALLVEQGL
ncbi:MAG: sulfate adenylyltransferase [Burkholderiales bacterium]|nr:sulfate adenylyltransferase [Burkholderiales bacterium]